MTNEAPLPQENQPTTAGVSKTNGELLINKYTAETTYAPSLEAVLSTVPPRKMKSDKQLIGVLQRVMMRGFQHDLEFPAISRLTCNTNETHSTVTMNIILNSAGDTEDISIQLPEPIKALQSAEDPLPLYLQFAHEVITQAAKELK
jgi:hypothetical protein